MDDGFSRRVRAIFTILALTAPCWSSGCHPVTIGSKVLHIHHSELGTDSEVCENPTVETLARDLDKLEQHIERYGSVVAKQPDVWGQARLTKHRQEFEAQMAAQLGTFLYTLQGSVAQSDQAYFADSLALSAAAAPRGPRAAAAPSTTVASSSSSTATPASSSSSSPTAETLPLPTPIDAFGAFNSISRTPVTTPPVIPFAGVTTGITVEPTVLLDQRARFINHLQELRRINEGDDTADSPGYALNLVRIPISVLPGKFTKVGYGAEVTITMNSYLSDDLLPTTFRNLVVNDLIEQLGFPITQFINNPENSPYFDEIGGADIDDLIQYLQQYSINDCFPDDPNSYSDCLLAQLKKLLLKPGLQPLLARPEWHWIDNVRNEPPLEPRCERLPQPGRDPELRRLQRDNLEPGAQQRLDAAQKRANYMRAARSSHAIGRGWIPIPATKSRRAKLPFPPSEIYDVYGYDFERLTIEAYRGLAKEKFSHPTTTKGPVFYHLPDVQGYLQQELLAAYLFLQRPENLDLWMTFCRQELAQAVREHKHDYLDPQRLAFKTVIAQKTAPVAQKTTPLAQCETPPPSTSIMSSLAWAIIVESALLTEQLNQDMREAAAAKGAFAEAPVSEGLPYYLPNPPPEARQAFNRYVQIRWPIHVFALDPASQQQNIVDTFSGRREMQLAMSMAFVSGRLSANNMMRFARRIEYDFATVDLNGTEIGFSHGDETFGWRFYPRFQTPDIESNATVFCRDLLIGGPNRDALLQMRRLEPGIRECVAVVVMPSFVPYATFNVSANWFKLKNPKSKELDSTDAMRLSRLVKNIQTCAPKVGDAACYRDGDFMRLLEKAKQLEARLPLQNTMVQIPYENTLGGFAMFNTGVTDLAPELTGFYGTEAIDTSAATTLFLVGNHFSVHQTNVIAGGQTISQMDMLSRQVLQVTIPKKPLLVGDKVQKFVDVQLATPYGISQHLLIPAIVPDAAAAGAGGSGGTGGSNNAPSWQTTSVDLAFVYSGLGIAPVTSGPGYRPPTLLLSAGTIDPTTFDQVDVVLDFSKTLVGSGTVSLVGNAYDAVQGGYVINSANLPGLIFTAVGSLIGPQATNPAGSVTPTAKLTFRSSTNAATPQTLQPANDLQINFIPGAGKSPAGQ